MRQRPGRTSMGLATACALLAVTGCSSSSSASSPATGSATPTASSVQPSPSPSHTTAHPTPTTTPGVPEPGSMATPAATSGPLSRASFPTTRQLGTGWRYAVDPGDAEDGYAGNGTPTLARSPQEIVQTAVPLGCARDATMPAPQHALEADYTLRGATAIAVRGRFASTAQAARFFTARASNLRACLGHRGSTAIGPLVGSLTEPTKDALASDRTPTSDPWHELAVLDGDTVVLLAVQGEHPLDRPTTRTLVRLFRS